MLHVGFGTGDITPAEDQEMPGGFTPRFGKGVRDRLIASACVLSDGSKAVAIVGVDALALQKETVEEARRLVARATDIPGPNVLVGANHTHSGGPTVTIAGDDSNAEYTAVVARRIAEAVEQAWRSLHAAEIGVGTGREDTIAFNRRFLMRDGREITHPGKPGTPHHGEIVRPAGPTDPEVGVLAARAPDGTILGVIVHFTCHSTVVGGDQFSPDYAGDLRRHLRARYGEGLPVVFLLGACGDITQVDNLSTANEFGPEYADLIGRKLAAEATRTIGRMGWSKDTPLAVATEAVPLAIRPDPDPERERPAFGLGSAWDEIYAKERAHVAAERARTPTIPCEVQALRVGPLGLVTNGSEYFCEYGLRIKACSPLTPTWVVTLANEYIGYVPTAQAFVGGGYEPRTARSSKLAPDAGQRLVEASLVALGKVAP